MCDTCDPCEQIIKEGPVAAARQVVLDAHQKKRFYRLSVFLFDVPIVILGVMCLFGGALLATILFLVLQQAEQRAINDLLNTERALTAERFGRYVQRATVNIGTVGALIAMRGSNITLEEFNLMSDLEAEADGTRPFYTWSTYVTPSALPAVREFLNTQYSTDPKIDFEIWENDSNGKRVPSSMDKGEWWPVAYSNPIAVQGIGFDISSDPLRSSAIARTWETGEVVATGRTLMSFDAVNSNFSTMIYSRVVDKKTGNKRGIIGAVFRVSDMVTQALRPDAHITTFDATGNEAFLYATKSEWNVVADDVKQKQLYDQLTAMETSGEIPKRIQVNVGDRKWSMFVTLSDQLIKKSTIDLQAKWIALALSLVFGVVAFATSIGVLILKRLLYTATVNGLMTHKIEELEGTREKMDSLIQQLSTEEQRIRSVMNLIPMSVLIVDVNGTVTYGNEQFLHSFMFPASHIEQKQLQLGQILPQLDMQTLTKDKIVNGTNLMTSDRLVFRTVMRTKLGVDRMARACISYNATLNTDRRNGGLLRVRRQWRQRAALDDCFVVILFDNQYDSLGSERSAGKSPREGMKRQQVDPNSTMIELQESIGAFYRMLYDEEKAAELREFREFCEREHSVEGLLFFAAVERFRATERVMDRVEVQRKIVQDFLKGMASPHQLNLPNQHLVDRLPRILEYTGRVDVFDGLLELVLSDLRYDLFDRYYTQRKHASLPATATATATIASVVDTAAEASVSEKATEQV